MQRQRPPLSGRTGPEPRPLHGHLLPLVLVLAGCASTGGEAGLERARLRAAAGDLEGAVALAETAFDEAPSDHAAAALGDLRSRLAARRRAEAGAAMDAGDALRAETLLLEAERLHGTEEGRRALAAARLAADDVRAARFAGHAADLERAVEARNWTAAVDAAREAHRVGGTDATRRAERFALAMAEAEAAADDGDTRTARLAFDRALATGLQREATLARRAARVPLSYAVTLHAAAILPFEPGSEHPWDGPPIGLEGPARLLSLLAALVDAETFGVRLAVEQIVRWSQQAVEAPDCAVTVTLDDLVFGGVETAVEDTFHPVWDLRLTLRGTTTDPRILGLRVTDVDLQHDDDVGAWTTTVGDLLQHRGIREIPLLDAGGRPLAGGIVGLRLSVEPLDGQPDPALPR